MSNVGSFSKAPRGLSFSIADLALVTAWSQTHSLVLIVQLDFGTEEEEYEEVLAFYSGPNASCRCIMWRDAEIVWVQPIVGRSQCYDSVVEAIGSIDPKYVLLQTDTDP